MHITSARNAAHLTLALTGRLDSITAPRLQQALELEGVSALVLDLAGCDYVSSAGLREFLRAHKSLSARKGSAVLANVSPEVQAVLELTGFAKFMQIRPRARQVDVTGLELISAGACGECYRLDRETVVKLYHEGIDASIAEQEKAYAMAAFVAGIPTAISYDVVASGARSGVVYEMLDAHPLGRLVREDLDSLPRHAAIYAEVASTIHATEADPEVFPDIKARLAGYLPQMAFFLAADEIAFLQQRLAAIPDASTFVHFDLHTSNIMIKDGEPLIIDMGDVSRGHPLFDVGLIYMIFGFPELGICERVTRIPDEAGARLWEHFSTAYFADKPPALRELFEHNRHFLAAMRAVYTITFFPQMRETLARSIREDLMPRMRAEGGALGLAG